MLSSISPNTLILGGISIFLACCIYYANRRFKIEKKLRQLTESHLSLVMNSMSDGVVVTDSEGNFLLFNPVAENIIGLGAMDIIPDEWSQAYGLFFPDTKTPIDTDDLPLYRALKGNSVDNYKIFVRNRNHPNGIYINVDARPLYKGRVLAGAVAIVRDITAAVEAHSALQRSEEQNRALINAIPDLIFRLSRDGVYLDCKAAKDIPLIMPLSELIGKNMRDVVSPELAHRTVQAMHEAFSSQSVVTFEYHLIFNQNLFHFEARIMPCAAHEVMAIIRNITRKKNLEKEILEISDREQERIGRDLHDGLGQQLTGIALMSKSLSQILKHQGNLESKNAEDISILANESIAQCRSLSRGLYPVELKDNGLLAALEELVARCENFYKIRCVLNMSSMLAGCDTDLSLHLYRIVQEAINNAIKHGDAKNISIDLEKTQGVMRLSIIDDGLGFGEDAGKGMGFNIMRYRASVIGAELDVKSQKNKGTEVICTFQI